MKANLLNLKLFLLLVVLAQFGFPFTSYGVFWEGLYAGAANVKETH